MTARKQRRASDAEALHEYVMRERIERGEKVSGSMADWLDRRGTAANAGRRADASTRRAKRHFGPDR